MHFKWPNDHPPFGRAPTWVLVHCVALNITYMYDEIGFFKKISFQLNHIDETHGANSNKQNSFDFTFMF
jgi:hypothetical protein